MYIVIEIQKTTDVVTLVTTYSSRAEAEQKYHQILSYAAVSTIDAHSVVMLSEEGAVLRSECYRHDTEEPVFPV